MYSQKDLIAGRRISLPWPGKGKVTNWSVAVSYPNALEKPTEKKGTKVSGVPLPE